MNTTKLTRKQIKEGLTQVPIEAILGKSVTRELTPKQRGFALDVAQGSTAAAAYRKNYQTKAKPKTVGDAASRLKGDARISAEIEAYQLAIEAAKHRTPAQLRDLVIHSLVQVVIDPGSKGATKVAAAKVLGSVVGVDAFEHRSETKLIVSSGDAKAQILAQLKAMMKAQAVDAVEVEAGSLLSELSGVTDVETVEPETHRTATPQDQKPESQGHKHTIPLKRLDSELIPLKQIPQESTPCQDPTPLDMETPPGSET